MLYSRAFAGRLQPLEQLLEGWDMSANERARAQLKTLSGHLGIPIRKASPEALAAIARYRAREAADRAQ